MGAGGGPPGHPGDARAWPSAATRPSSASRRSSATPPGKAAERCAQHCSWYIGRLIALARIAALNGYDLGDPWQKALDCARFELDVTGHIETLQGSGSVTPRWTTDWKNEKLLNRAVRGGSDLRGEQDITYTAWSVQK